MPRITSGMGGTRRDAGRGRDHRRQRASPPRIRDDAAWTREAVPWSGRRRPARAVNQSGRRSIRCAQFLDADSVRARDDVEVDFKPSDAGRGASALMEHVGLQRGRDGRGEGRRGCRTGLELKQPKAALAADTASWLSVASSIEGVEVVRRFGAPGAGRRTRPSPEDHGALIACNVWRTTCTTAAWKTAAAPLRTTGGAAQRAREGRSTRSSRWAWKTTRSSPSSPHAREHSGDLRSSGLSTNSPDPRTPTSRSPSSGRRLASSRQPATVRTVAPKARAHSPTAPATCAQRTCTTISSGPASPLR